MQYPRFEDLPIKKDGPRLNAWGLFGPNDQLGKLVRDLTLMPGSTKEQNLLTPEMVREAAKEIQTGERCGLNWSMTEPHKPAYGRRKIEVTLIEKTPRHVHDDEVRLGRDLGLNG